MTSERNWDRVEALFERALGLPPIARRDLMNQECRDDPDLRRGIEALLSASDEAPDYLQRMRDQVLGPNVRDLLDETAEMDAAPDQLVGSTVTRYEILDVVGGGGMGVVYRALDQTLGRVVALKFLTPGLSADLAARARFVREARAASALDHPNICTVHEITEAEDGRMFIAMACYEGETLKARIARGPVPVDEALAIGGQIARGLAAAHAAGVVHRDVKPANVFLTESGVVKLLDFGLADSGESTAGDGTVGAAGTAAYMSPEQARGGRTDARTDVWSLGAVLYEMLTGQHAFEGETPREILQGVLSSRPDFTLLPAERSDLSRVIRTALGRNRPNRYADGSSMLAALRECGVPVDYLSAEPAPTALTGPRRGKWRVAAALALGVAGVVTWQAAAGRRPVPALPEPRQISFSGDVIETAMSHDGRSAALIVQEGDSQILKVIEVDSKGSLVLATVPKFLCCAAWSPDGTRIAYRTLDGNFVLPRLGGAHSRFVPAHNIAAWSPDGTQLYSWWPQSRTIMYTDVATGDTTTAAIDLEYDWVEGIHWSPVAEMLAVALLDSAAAATLWTMRTDGSGARLLVRDTVQVFAPHWGPDGRSLYYLRDPESAALWKTGVNADGSARGRPERVTATLTPNIRNPSLISYSISQSGRRLLYPRLTHRSNLWRFPLDSGPAATGRPLTSGTARRLTPRIAPDDSTIAYLEAAGRATNVFLIPASGGTAAPLTFTQAHRWHPVWSPEGRELAFGISQNGAHAIQIIDRDGTTRGTHSDASFYPDNHLAWTGTDTIVYVQRDDRTLRLLDLSDRSEHALVADSSLAWFYDLRPSPDGRRLALYRTRRPYDDGMVVLFLEDGSAHAAAADMAPIGWAPDGMTIYAMTSGGGEGSRTVFRISASGGTPEVLFTLPLPALPWNVSVSADGTWLVASLEQSTSDAWIIDNFDPTVR